MTKLTRLFQPGMIGTMEVKNRIVMSPMGTHSADPQGHITDRTIDYYVERAKGGVGLVISQGTPILREGRTPDRSWLWDDKFIPKLRELSQAVHQYGTKMAIQVHHNGKVLFKARLSFKDPKEAEEIDVIGPSAVPWIWNGLAPREMSKEDIKHLVEAFAEGARRTKDADFDAVEFHGAHGYLISSFLSPFTNKRTDEYGGSVQNRARFVCEILARAREKVGPDFPLILRISGSDYLPRGITIEQTVNQAPLFVEAGVNALHVSASAQETTQWQFLSYLWPDAAITHLAEAVRKVVKVPVITVGKIGDPLLAERILREGKADFVAMGRALLADPDLPSKAREGRLDEIRRCIYCNNCLSVAQAGGLAKSGIASTSTEGKPTIRGIFCTVNPALLKEREFAIKPTSSPKKVMVIGGGLSGMEAARVLAERGHQVSLYEKSDRLGGQWNIACLQEHKKSYASAAEYISRGLESAGVKIILNKEVTTQFVKDNRPDAVVVATGATPKTPDVPGAQGKNVVQAVDVIAGNAKVGKKVVVVGGRLVGMEVADSLAKQGKTVALITMYKLGEDGRPLNIDIYRTLRGRMIEHGVFIHPDSPLFEITDKGVYAVNDRELFFLEADTVVLAVGMKSESKLVEELKGILPEVYTIGDCVEPRDAMFAIREGAEIARQI
ncbi:MAG: FAD-dependent oxidoreductase [Thermodesulfobacteriota bacterium]|nr:FAD-dependent oxidoreductase [Thermodesulfobacteriota bacterium]